MKLFRTILLALALTALNVSAADTPTGSADMAVTNAPATATNVVTTTNKSDKSVDLQLEFGSGAREISPEVLNKLTSDQIMELEKLRNSRSSPETFLVPLGFFACVIAVVAIVVSARMKRQKLMLETLRVMAEKGTHIPPEVLQLRNRPRRPRSDFRTGLVLLAVGLAFVIKDLAGGERPGLPGLIPALMGVAFLISWKFDQHKDKDGQP